jgi:hypothetical protein
MLRVSIHAGLLAERTPFNQIGTLDIGYHARGALADYIVALQLMHKGELEPAFVRQYPRWSGSVWDLVARALGAVLYRDKEVPAVARVDKRCAYATKLCAVIQESSAEGLGRQIAQVEILQPGRERGQYVATFDEDILGPRTAEFAYGCKVLNVADLLLRAICYAWWGKDVPGEPPGLILPAAVAMEGALRFDLRSLPEPARTGFTRHRANQLPLAKPEPLPKAEDYVAFLTMSAK